MRVLVLSHLYPRKNDEIRGIFVHKQAKALLQKGVEVKVVSPVPWSPLPISWLTKRWAGYSAAPEKESCEGVDVRYPRYLAFPRGWSFARSGYRMYRGARECATRLMNDFRADLIHAHTALPDGFAAALLSRDSGVPFVVTIHGRDIYHAVDRGPSCFRAVRCAIDSSSRVVLVSNALRTIAMLRFGDQAKFIVLPNGVDPLDVSPEKENELSGRKATRLLSVSGLIRTKGIDLNLRAIEALVPRHPDLVYTIVGDGPDRRRLNKLVSRLGLQKRVTFLGQLNHDDAMRQMAECDVFSLPSWREGFGVVYIEAMAHGKPVIGCRGEGVEDFVESGRTGLLVEPRSVESLVAALDRLLSRPDEALAIGQRARRVALEDYTWERNAEKTARVYREVIGASAH